MIVTIVAVSVEVSHVEFRQEMKDCQRDQKAARESGHHLDVTPLVELEAEHGDSSEYNREDENQMIHQKTLMQTVCSSIRQKSPFDEWALKVA